MIGQTISHYKITAKLGEGGMGVVYKAEDTKLERTVALKFLAAHLLQDEEANKRFHREAKAAASVHHPNVCPVYEIGEEDGRTFLAMAFIEGESLDKKIEQGPLTIQETLDISGQIAKGLEAAHDKGVVHRDIKPGNVMLDDKGHVTVMDFGLALLTEGSKLTQLDTTVGTVAYMSPEQAQGMNVDHRTDVWALGCVVYEMVRGERPFQGLYDQALLYEIVHEEPEPLTAVRTGVPMELEFIVGKCLAKDRENRYQRASELIVDLRAPEEKLTSARSRPMSAGGKRTVSAPAGSRVDPVASEPDSAPAPARSRLDGGFFAGLMLGATLAAAVLWFAFSSPTSDPAVPDYRVRQVTFDPGLTFQPALSRNGDLLAYSSDRAGEGSLDIWVQQLGGASEPIRLTDHPADDTEPHFSPDGRTIVFRSERRGGGVYLVPSLGGDSRLLVEKGRRPRFSPDGSLVAYWVGLSEVGTRGATSLGVVPAVGGEPLVPITGHSDAFAPIWTPDGKHLLFLNPDWEETAPWNWSVAAIETGEVTHTNFHEAAASYGLGRTFREAPQPRFWDPNGAVTFSVESVYSTGTESLWRIPLSDETWQTTGPPVRLTRGSGESQASRGGSDRIAFAGVTHNIDMWSLPVEADQARVTGEAERLTVSKATDFNAAISRDGRFIAFQSNRSGYGDIWTKDLTTGKLRALTLTPWSESSPAFSADASHVAYVARDGAAVWLGMKALAQGAPRKLVEGSNSGGGLIPWSFSSEGSSLVHLLIDNGRAAAPVLDLASGQTIARLEHPEYNLFQVQFSPDDRFFVFHVMPTSYTTQIFITPFREEVEKDPKRWIPVTDGQALDDKPRWSPDGNTIYFVSDRDGFACLWAQRLDPETKHRRGSAFAVKHFHQIQQSLGGVLVTSREIGVAPDKIVLPLSERSGNIWLMEPVAGVEKEQ